MLALMAFTVLALMALAMLALVSFAFVMAALMAFTFMLALMLLHHFQATHDEVFLLFEVKVAKVFPSSHHFFAFSFHLSAFCFTFSFGFFSHFDQFLTFSFNFSFLGLEFGIHLGEEFVSLLVQFKFGVLVHVIPVGVFSLQGAEGAVMLLSNDSLFLRLIGLLLLFGSIVASHHKEASKTHH